MKWIWDTNIISEIGAKRPNPMVLDWISRQPANDSAISIVTLAELRAGAAKISDEQHRENLNRWIDETIACFFDGRSLPLTIHILIDWLNLGRRLAANRTTREAADLLIASTARVHELILVTRNTRDFAGTGVTVYNPWTNETQVMESV